MESTSPSAAAQQLLACCLEGRPWPPYLPDQLIEGDASREMFRVVVERLGDLFEPRLCLTYAELFSGVISRVIPELPADTLLARYHRVRTSRRFDGARPDDVFVLSRVTLGADVAVTSVILDGAKRAFPQARIWFVGPRKSWELFKGDPRLTHVDLAYGRGGTLRERLSGWTELRDAVSRPNSIVIDPDSRLTQLGLLPICAEENYFLFESRSFGGDSLEPLPELASRWMEETFGVPDARAYIQTGLPARPFAATASFGVGENPAKRVGDPFEAELIRQLPRPALVDTGAGGEEAERVRRAVAQAGGGVETFSGSFAAFASHIASSGRYVGYDSAGGHVAAACGVPLVCVFAGAVSDRMFARWRPWGPGEIRVERR
ncbi:MAG: hypothetical protein M3O35_14825 [Acidobacteriota bacterium]|nr:hypothetical protein [Acidobacteriota bacterium]